MFFCLKSLHFQQLTAHTYFHTRVNRAKITKKSQSPSENCDNYRTFWNMQQTLLCLHSHYFVVSSTT